MTTSPSPSRAAGGRLPRFDGAERALHWANTALFGVLAVTAALLYVGPLSAVVGRRALVRDVHVVAGLLWPVPFVVARLGPWSRRLRDDVRLLGRWDAHDSLWVRSLGRDPTLRLGKFHPGQKLNAAFTAGAIPVMLVTGSVMRWFDPFPVAWRTGATFVHDWLAVALFLAVGGHVAKALADPEAMAGMRQGRVGADWARRHHPRWHDELTSTEARR